MTFAKADYRTTIAPFGRRNTRTASHHARTGLAPLAPFGRYDTIALSHRPSIGTGDGARCESPGTGARGRVIHLAHNPSTVPAKRNAR